MIIFKYPIKFGDIDDIDMPIGAKILSVQFQSNTITIWALVDPEVEKITRTFRVIGTGHPIEDAHKLKYLATVQEPGFVWHVFEQVS